MLDEVGSKLRGIVGKADWLSVSIPKYPRVRSQRATIWTNTTSNPACFCNNSNAWNRMEMTIDPGHRSWATERFPTGLAAHPSSETHLPRPLPDRNRIDCGERSMVGSAVAALVFPSINNYYHYLPLFLLSDLFCRTLLLR